jgi:CO/xanthine dehydrogenase FAD-binding subunit
MTPTVHSPKTLDEAYQALADGHGQIKVIAGGTDLMVMMNARTLDARGFLNIWRLDEMRCIVDEGNTLNIGALTTYTNLIRSPLAQQHAPSLVAASRTIGAIQIQNRGTIGGNIANASPAGDTLPVLAALDAELEIGSLRGKRRVLFNDFYTGYRSTVLEPDELLLAVRIPKLAGARDFFHKIGTRRAQAISKVVLAAKARAWDGKIDSINIAVGSVAPTVIRVSATERLLANSTIDSALIAEARRTIAREIKPITDARSTEHYRRAVTGNVLAGILRQLVHS